MTFVYILFLLSVPAAAGKPPNVLFIMADDLGFNDLDWKDPNLYTPTLRELAHHQHTIQLTNSYVNQLCTPTRSAFMTGYYPFRTGTQNGVFLHMEPSGVPSLFPFLPENLRSLGYSTYLIGKWHLGYCRKEYLPTSRGFDYFYGFYGPQTGYFNHSADQYHRDIRRVVKGVDLFEEVGDGTSVPDFNQDGIYATRHNKSKPFFMFLSHQAVHPPLQVPRSYEVNCMRIEKRLRRIYCGMLAAMDFSVSRVIQYLKDEGIYNDTIIVFTSDNGGTVEFGASNAPLRGEKDTLWEGGTRTNTFIHAPGFIKNFAARDQLFHVVDWHATILGIAGVDLQSYGDGINQWEYIKTGTGKMRRFQFVYNIGEHGSAIRDGDYKLLYGNPDRKIRKDDGKLRLFKITEDPGESKNIARSNPTIVRRLLAKLKTLQKYMRPNVRRPLSLLGSPERLNGSYGSFWCTQK